MYCPKCGSSNLENAAFCAKCGADLRRSKRAADAGQTNQGLRSSGEGNVAERRIRTMASSPVFLVCAIALSLAVAAQLINSFAEHNSMMSMLAGLSMIIDIPPDAARMISSYSSGNVLGKIVGMIPTILIVTGVWMTFASAMNRSYGKMQTSGLTVIKVAVIITLVCWSLLLILVELLLFITMASLPRYSRDATPYLVAAILITLIVFGIQIFYQICIVKTIKRGKEAITTGREEVTAASTVVAIFDFITGGFTALGVVLSRIVMHAVYEQILSATGIWLGNMGGSGLFSVIAQIATATYSIAFGILLMQYRSNVLSGSGVQKSRYSAQPASARQQSYAQAQPVPVRQQSYAQAQPAYARQQTYAPAQQASQAGRGAYTTSVGSPETVVLKADQHSEAMPWLERSKNGEKIYVTTLPFKIGKAPSGVNYCIADNAAISRNHAELVRSAEGLCVVDKSSTNHVYINDMQIPAEVPVPLSDDCILKLGDEAFVFHC